MASGPENNDFMMRAAVVVVATLTFFMAIYFTFFNFDLQKSVTKDVSEGKDSDTKGKSKSSKKKGKEKENKKVLPKQEFCHKWLAATFKAHADTVTTMATSLNGKYLASCAKDQSVLIWMMEDVTASDHKHIRLNVRHDHASVVFWSPDEKAFILYKEIEKTVGVFKLNKKTEDSHGRIQPGPVYAKNSSSPIKTIAIPSNGKFLMTCSAEGTITIWDLKGSQLFTQNISSNPVHCCALSLCGHYLTIVDRNGSIKFWEVVYGPDKNFSGLEPSLFKFAQHIKHAVAIDFSMESDNLIVLDKENWKMFHLNGSSIVLSKCKQLETASDSESVVRLGVGSLLAAVSIGEDLFIYSVMMEELLKSLKNIHNGPLTDVRFTVDNDYFITSGDKHIRVFHNFPGHMERAREFKKQLEDKSMSKASRDRILKQLENLNSKISALKEKIEKKQTA